MRPYEHKRANEIRVTLIVKLGGRCNNCGTKRKLEFNHIFRRTWTANRFNMYQRMLRIQKEANDGLINLLCRNCNGGYAPLALTLSQRPF